MKFNFIETNKLLNLRKCSYLTFEVIVTEPAEVKEHIIKHDSKYKVEPCTGKTCDYCATFRVMSRTHPHEAKQFIAHKRYHLPVIVGANVENITPDTYIFRFSNQVYRAYQQLLVCADTYKFNSDNKLTFTYRKLTKHGFPDYCDCSFNFKKKSLTVNKLLQDVNKVFYA